MSHNSSFLSLWRPGGALALATLLSGCGGGYDCLTCNGYPPVELSAGVVAGDFNGDGYTDIVQLSSVHNGLEPDPANLKSYLSTAAGMFAAPDAHDRR